MTAKKALFAQSKNAHDIKRNVEARSELFAFAAGFIDSGRSA